MWTAVVLRCRWDDFVLPLASRVGFTFSVETSPWSILEFKAVFYRTKRRLEPDWRGGERKGLEEI